MTAQLRHVLRQIGEVALHAREPDDRIALASDIERRQLDRHVVERREQFPIAVDIAIPVETAAKPSAGEFASVIVGTFLGLGFGDAMIPAIVVGSLLASHTLLSVPIVQRLGVIRLEPIVVTIGAMVLSDTVSLVVFAVCVSMYTTGFSVSGLAIQLGEIIVSSLPSCSGSAGQAPGR